MLIRMYQKSIHWKSRLLTFVVGKRNMTVGVCLVSGRDGAEETPEKALVIPACCDTFLRE